MVKVQRYDRKLNFCESKVLCSRSNVIDNYFFKISEVELALL